MQGSVTAAYLRHQAARCRRLAEGGFDRDTVSKLRHLAVDYELKASEIDRQDGRTS